jgi:hypothetical protein
VSQIDSQLRDLLEQAVGDPPRHIAVPVVRHRVVRRRITETAAAAIAVVAVAVGGTAVAAQFTDAAGRPAAPDAAADRGAPPYYLQVSSDAGAGTMGGVLSQVTSSTHGRPTVTMTMQDALLVRSTVTGGVTGRIRCPEGAGWWVDQTAIAAVTNRAFIVACMEQPAALKPDVDTTQTVLLRVRLTAAGRVAAITAVPNGHLSHGAAEVTDVAATPDGREIAVATSPGDGHMNIEVLNTVTGRWALWRGSDRGDYWSLSLTSNGRVLVFIGAPCLGVGRCTSRARIMEVGPATQGGTLASTDVIMTDLGMHTFAAISPDGSAVVVARVRPANTLIVQRIIASTGRLLDTLYAQSGPGAASVSFLAADPSGRYLIVNGTVAGTAVSGWIRAGRLVPLQSDRRGVYWEAW